MQSGSVCCPLWLLTLIAGARPPEPWAVCFSGGAWNSQKAILRAGVHCGERLWGSGDTCRPLLGELETA